MILWIFSSRSSKSSIIFVMDPIIIWSWIVLAQYSNITAWVPNWNTQWHHAIMVCARISVLSSCSWWRHQMETFSALLALCAGNSPVPVNSPHKGQWRRTLMFSLICAWINDWVNNPEAADLRRHRGHYGVNVTYEKCTRRMFATQYCWDRLKRWNLCMTPSRCITKMGLFGSIDKYFHEMAYLKSTVCTFLQKYITVIFDTSHVAVYW